MASLRRIFYAAGLLALPIHIVAAVHTNLTSIEQAVIGSLLTSGRVTGVSSNLVLIDEASLPPVMIGESYKEFSSQLRRSRQAKVVAIQEAIEDFIGKNAAPSTIQVSQGFPKEIPLISREEHDRMFPKAECVASISRVGIDSKNSVAIVYLGWSAPGLRGGGRIWILKRTAGKWVLQADHIGPQWAA